MLETVLEWQLCILAAIVLGEVTCRKPEWMIAIVIIVLTIVGVQWLSSLPMRPLTPDEYREMFGDDDEYRGP